MATVVSEDWAEPQLSDQTTDQVLTNNLSSEHDTANYLKMEFTSMYLETQKIAKHYKYLKA